MKHARSDRIPSVDPDQATGDVKHVYDAIQAQMGRVPNVFQALSLRPPLLAATANLVGALMLSEGALTRELKEMIAVVVSAANRCRY